MFVDEIVEKIGDPKNTEPAGIWKQKSCWSSQNR